jgi:hypothetical protein
MTFHRLATLALAVAPYVGIGALIRYCQKNKDFSLNDELEISPLQRKALLVHFGYFLFVPILIEVFPDAPGLDILVGPAQTPSNVLHMVSCLAAENFFVTSAALGMILTQDSVPRWSLMTLAAQLAWNLKNHLSWYFLGNMLAPEGPLLFALADMVLIWPITAIYSHHFFTGKKVDKKD